MSNPSRSVVVIAGLVTVLVLAIGTTAVAFRNGWIQLAAQADVNTPPAALPTAALSATDTSMAPADVETYKQKLTEAYRALDEAYAQIRALQAAQSQTSVARRGGESDDDDDRRERRSGHRERGER